MRTKLILAAFVLIAYVLTCVTIATGAYFRAGLSLSYGVISDTRIRASRDIVDEAATEANRQAARILAENLTPVFAPDPMEWSIVENNLVHLHASLLTIRAAYDIEMLAYETALSVWEEKMEAHRILVHELSALHQEGFDLLDDDDEPNHPPLPPQPEEPLWLGESMAMFSEVAFPFTEAERQTILNMTDEGFDAFWDAVVSVTHAVQTEELIQNIGWLEERAVQVRIGDVFADRTTAALIENIALRHLRSNAVYDTETNERRFLLELANYEQVIIYEGQIIIDEGEMVTEEVLSILDALGMLAPDSLTDSLAQVFGVYFLVGALFLVGLMYMAFYTPKLGSNIKDAGLLFTLYVLTISLAWALNDFSYFFLPILIFPLLTSILIGRRLAMVLTFVVVVACYFIVQSDLIFLLYFSIAGFLVCLFSRYTTERTKIILVGIFVSMIQFFLSFAILLIAQEIDIFVEFRTTLTLSVIAAVNGLLTVIISMGSLPFWETLFGVVTPIKLLDLTNPTNLLLRRLTIEAPGTYHHSLIVANLAETAAYDVGANTHAARVGGYYHDIGKLKSPHYFVENLDGENPHDHLEPLNSAQLIMCHVSYGLTLAGEHRVPQFVRDIIKEHHGTTLMQYFYTKARNSGIQADESDFRYPFSVPSSRESAIVMLADSVEAAARSMMPRLKSLDELKTIIDNIIRGKLSDGQLADSQLSIRDVSVIETSFFRVLKGMYHERIAYPAPKKENEQKPVRLKREVTA